MGSNATQAAGVAVLLIAFVVLAEGLFVGGSVLLAGLALALLAVSAVIFLRAKRMEQAADE